MNEKKKRKTGLGTQAFFQSTEQREAEPAAEEAAEVEEKEAEQASEPEKTRTTIWVYPGSLDLLELLKTHERIRTGEKIYQADVLHEALEALAEKKGLELPS